MTEIPKFANSKTVSKRRDGILIGFNFEGFIFVIVDVVPLEEAQSLDNLSEILTENKFRAFSWSCAGNLMVLGVLESKGAV